MGETKGQLNKRINGHRSEINHGGSQLLYQHFNLPNHSILSMNVRILEKIDHPSMASNSPGLSTPFRRQREEHYFRTLGTAVPYGCNDRIDSIGNLSSPGCSSVNVMNLFPTTQRRARSHGHRCYKPFNTDDISFDNLVDYVERPLGLHHIRTKLFSLRLSKLKCLFEESKSINLDGIFSAKKRLVNVIKDILTTGCSNLYGLIVFHPQRVDIS